MSVLYGFILLIMYVFINHITMIISISSFWKPSSLLGLLIDRNVLGYNWDYLKSGLRLSVNLKIKNSDTTYGMMFDTMSVSSQTKKTNKKWATFLSTFFDYNKDNQNIMLSAAKNNLNQKVNSFLFSNVFFKVLAGNKCLVLLPEKAR